MKLTVEANVEVSLVEKMALLENTSFDKQIRKQFIPRSWQTSFVNCPYTNACTISSLNKWSLNVYFFVFKPGQQDYKSDQTFVSVLKKN